MDQHVVPPAPARAPLPEPWGGPSDQYPPRKAPPPSNVVRSVEPTVAKAPPPANLQCVEPAPVTIEAKFAPIMESFHQQYPMPGFVWVSPLPKAGAPMGTGPEWPASPETHVGAKDQVLVQLPHRISLNDVMDPATRNRMELCCLMLDSEYMRHRKMASFRGEPLLEFQGMGGSLTFVNHAIEGLNRARDYLMDLGDHVDSGYHTVLNWQEGFKTLYNQARQEMEINKGIICRLYEEYQKD